MYADMNEAVDHSDGKKTVKPFKRVKMLNKTGVIQDVYGCSTDLCVSFDLGTPCMSRFSKAKIRDGTADPGQ